VTFAVALIATGAWVYILFLRGGFWLARERDDRGSFPDPERWPSVVAVVPARNEADVIGASIGSLAAQDYPGSFRIILVDDSSDDGTAAAAPPSPRLEVLTTTSLPTGWTGKLWAVNRGVEHASQTAAPDYLLLTDADIRHSPDNLRSLVARAEAKHLVLTSLMAKLNTDSRADRLMIPAFVFFFAMLYPFAWVNDPERKTAAAAGGCMLVIREALERAGGIGAIRHEIIDDCALSRLMKPQGPIWIGLTERVRSLRPYGGLGAIGRMVARSAYAQLGYSPVMLAGTVASMVIVYLAAPMLALTTHGAAMVLSLSAWAAMLVAVQPTLRFYRLSPLWGVAMPLIALLYLAFTLRSAFDVWRGKGGQWKGRAQAAMGGAT
jgi:hopene-associated glycosyltransferase HpnB